MSHLLKENKIILIIFKLFVLSLIIFIFYNGLINYKGNKYLYILFSIVSNYLIIFSFRKKAIFFDTFFSLLLWLGFWFKLTVTISFTDGMFREGAGLFDYSSDQFNSVIIISMIAILAIILSGHVREFFFTYPNKIDIKIKYSNYYLKNRNLILLLFFILVTLIFTINSYFKIYQRGLVPIYEYNFIFSGIIKWLLLFGLSSIGCVILFIESDAYKKIFTLTGFLIVLETFMSSTSMLSRGMIFNSLAILYGIYKYSNKAEINFRLADFIKILLSIFILFYISAISVNQLRAKYFYVGKSFEKTQSVNEETKNEETKATNQIIRHNRELLYLIVNRWVGIDGVMSVDAKKEILNFSLLKDSFKERFSKNNPTFYENTFGLEEGMQDVIYKNVKGNTLPGIIAFLFYSGSYLFLFSSLIVLCFLASLIEIIAFKAGGKNLIFAALIAEIIAFRFIHFGYLPHQSYLLFGTIFLTLLMIFFFKKIFF